MKNYKQAKGFIQRPTFILLMELTVNFIIQMVKIIIEIFKMMGKGINYLRNLESKKKKLQVTTLKVSKPIVLNSKRNNKGKISSKKVLQISNYKLSIR